MKENLFDNIGKKLNEYQSPIDLDMEWNRVLEGQQENRKKKRNIWMACFFLAFLGASLIYLAVPNSNSVTAKESNSSLDSKTIEPHNLNSNVVDVEGEKRLDAMTDIKSLVDEVKKASTKKIIPIEPVKINSDGAISKESKLSVEEIKPLRSNDLPQNSKSISRNINVIKDIEKKEPLSEVLLLESLTPKAIPILLVEDIPDPKLISSKPKRSIQFYFNSGLAITKQRFKAKNALSNEYSNLRGNSETPLETYTYDIGANVPIGKKSFVKIGGNYNVNFDKINHVYEVPKAFDLENVLIKKLVNPNTGAVEEVFGDTTIIGSQTITSIQYNTYRSTNLNVSFGHYLFSKNRFSLAITGGLFYNISLSAKGKIISPENEQATLVTLDGYKKSFGLGLIGGADIDFKINESWMLNLRPTASYGVFSATNQSNVLNSNFYKYGISLGIKYKL